MVAHLCRRLYSAIKRRDRLCEENTEGNNDVEEEFEEEYEDYYEEEDEFSAIWDMYDSNEYPC